LDVKAMFCASLAAHPFSGPFQTLRKSERSTPADAKHSNLIMAGKTPIMPAGGD